MNKGFEGVWHAVVEVVVILAQGGYEDMYDLINLPLFFIQILIVLNAMRNLLKKILDFGSIFELLYGIWYIPIIYDMLFGRRMFGYAYESVTKNYSRYFIYDTVAITKFNLITTLIMVAFALGYSSYRDSKTVRFEYRIDRPINKYKYYFAQSVLFSFWAVLEIRGFFKYGGSIAGFFAATKKDMYGSEIVEILIVKIPLLVFANYFYFNASIRRKKIGIIYWILVLFPAIQTHQRREMIANFLFAAIVYFSYYATTKNVSTIDSQILNRRMKKYMVIVFFAVVCMVPLFWFLRVHDNQVINKGVTEVKYTRTFLEVLLFGGGATGFPTLIVFDVFRMEHGVNFFFHNILFLLQSFIPRRLFPGKTSPINLIIRDMLGINANLSSFYINELYFTFGLFSILISFLIGRVFSKLYNRYTSSLMFDDKLLMALFLANIVNLFKNGLVSFLIHTVFIVILFYADLSYLGISEKIRILKGKVIIKRRMRWR